MATLRHLHELAVRYGASIFWLREGMLGEAAMREFLLGWQTRRDGALRGMHDDGLAVPLRRPESYPSTTFTLCTAPSSFGGVFVD